MSTNTAFHNHFTARPINRKQRRQKPQREFSNKKGIQLVVVNKMKFKKVIQRIGKRTIVHPILTSKN
ncbi:hypothetical protein [Elizabethkingia anophelis]|uniref:hypothetical protein n=1 Tax=Elizabethkingia anophelis TaxID=1117645 RepID=UPI00132FD231|nr:hypothetical protein [Elizabethkingia anophelis]